MTLKSANEVLAEVTNAIEIEYHISWEPLLAGVHPTRRGQYVVRGAGVNWNKTYNVRKVMEIICNYSESNAPRVKPRAHDPINSSDLLSLMLPNVKGNNDMDPQVVIPMEDLVAHGREPDFISLRPSSNQANWGHEYFTNMKALLRKDLFQSAVKLEAAKQMGFLEAWTEMATKFAPGNNCWMDHRKPDGWVYIYYQNFQFLILAAGKFPFALCNAEGKHRSIAMWSLALCLHADTRDGSIAGSNVITYDIMVKNGVIKEGLQGREFRDDVEDFMMDTSKNSIRMNCNRTTVYYVNEQLPLLRSAKTLISSLNCISKLRSDAKTDSATPRSIDLIKGMV